MSSMTFEQIEVHIQDGVATVTLNRPDRLNAWTPHMGKELKSCFRSLADDDSVRVIILTGAGRGFCAGADIEALQAIDSGSDASSRTSAPFNPDAPKGFQGAQTWFPTVPQPIIAAINGPAAGLGLVLALWCDLRFAAEDAVFSSAFSRRGLIAEHGISWLLPRLVGIARAQDILLSARRISGAEAAHLGLVNATFKPDELMPSVRNYASMLATQVSPRSTRIMKRQLWEALGEGLEEALAIADAEMHQSFSSEDFKEGVASFAEKRSPAFTGR